MRFGIVVWTGFFALTEIFVAGNGSNFRCPFTVSPDGSKVNGTTAAKDQPHVDDIVWCLPETYTLEKPPFAGRHFSKHKLNLHFDFDILEVSSINDKAQSVTIPMYLSVAWIESRLWINESHEAWNENVTGPRNAVTEDPKILLDNLWVPDLEIYGLEEYSSAKLLKDMSGLRISKDKTIEYNTRATIVISCRMDFDNYPFDDHICLFQVGSYFYLKNIVTCTSQFNDPTKSDSMRQRNLQHAISFANLTENESVIQLSSGLYSACGFRIHLHRKRYQMIFQIYLPCILFVVVSWVSFMIRPSSVPGRMAMLVTLFLVLVNIFNTVRSAAPTSASTTLNAMDTYLVVSIFMVFLALLEYAVQLFVISVQEKEEITRKKSDLKESLSHLNKSRNITGKDIQEIIDEINSNVMVVSPSKAMLKEDYYKLGRISLRKFDFIALLVFPLTFFLFNVGYWTYYTFN